MKIAEIKQAEAGLKGFICMGKVFYIGEVKTRTNKTNGEEFTTQSIGVSDGTNKETDSIFVEFSNQEELTDEIKGKTISCISCKINDWQGKRNLRATQFSFDIIPETSLPKDPAHPVLPNTTVVPDKSTQKELETPKKAPVEASTWDLKDVKIIRQHCETDATSLVVKYFKGTLDEAIAQVITTSNILVDSVYQGLKFPIDNKQADLLKEIKTESDENVKESELDQLDIKALEYKKQLHELTGDDIEYGAILGKFNISQPYELTDKEDKAGLVTMLANKVIELKKG